MTHQKEIET